MVRRRVVVEGAVQGTFFREETRKLAAKRGVAGSIWNNADGTVEAIFEGAPEAVAQLVGFARRGPRGARVDHVEVSDEDPEGAQGFAVSKGPSARLSPSLAALAGRLPDRVDGFVLVEELLSTHKDYARGLAASFRLGDAPPGAEQRSVDEWIADVRPLFDAQAVPELSGRQLVFGVALLDPDVRERLAEGEFFDTLETEMAEHAARLAPGTDLLTRKGDALRTPDAVPTLSDAPSREDLLGRKPFADVLAARIDDEYARSRASFMVHLEGPWGAGKTSLLLLMGDALRELPSRWIIVDFNAWQHQRSAPSWWLLGMTVLRGAIRDPFRRGWWRSPGWWGGLVVGHRGVDVLRSVRLALFDFWWRVRLGWMAYLLLPAVAFAIWTYRDYFGGGGPVELVVTVGTAVGAALTVFGALRGLSGSLSLSSARGADVFIAHTRDPMNLLKKRFTRLVRTAGRPIAVFVDDLDRCRPDYLVELLEGIQTLLREAPVAYVVAADRHWLYKSYAKVYPDFADSPRDGGRPLGHLFLEKTFQLSTSVPRLSTSGTRAFWHRLIEIGAIDRTEAQGDAERRAERIFGALRSEPAIREALDRNPAASPEEERAFRASAIRQLASPELERRTQHTLKPFASLLDPNPRAMKRLVNAYGVERALQFLERRSLAHPHAREELALWTITRLRWPLLADYLTEDPESVADLARGQIPDRIKSDPELAPIARMFGDRDVRRVVSGEGIGVGLSPEGLNALLGLDEEPAASP